MEAKQPLFELPKLFALDGQEVTEDRLLNESLLGHTCTTGTGPGSNSCSNGSSTKEVFEE
jgi:hypothetical protein